ncbi:ATP-binding cassette domain-containing protein [Consotaella salsifontis]|uniref:Mannose ABC transporter ATP-binding protein /fructose ABC transporter ATP-binding protein /ribose ABC transporter ATP-binding protein n=1 Tax=Consotaella salsifontis TaxID=1365950 RepID=A0A1T4T8Q3_9HYPH|nr:ATP-binding cassette domain-containing protein [Consotaella salsifontis]SKA36872.1 mannose ABC transporter ATP-binding protein /fructose ABC transporter ATP-binding protein /ribose ABC transporter ATP-binding protein [Consotaella salsifontis]
MKSIPVLSARGLVKRYGEALALDGADFDLYPGEILVIAGEAGSGCSTLLSALSGAVEPEAGEIRVWGEPARFREPREALLAGLESVGLRPALIGRLSVLDNFFLGREVRRRDVFGRAFRMLDRAAMKRIAEAMLLDTAPDFPSNLDQAVACLPLFDRRILEIARAVAFASQAVLLDEPTVGLDEAQARCVVDLILEVKARGLAIAVASGEAPAVWSIADRIHIQRRGRRYAVVDPTSTGPAALMELMAGRRGGLWAGAEILV